MAFTVIRPERGNAGLGRPAMSGVRVQRVAPAPRGAAPRSVFRFGADVLSQMQWTRGDRIAVAVGTGEHGGWVRLWKDAALGFALTTSGPKGKAQRLASSRIGSGATCAAAPAKYRIDGDALLVYAPQLFQGLNAGTQPVLSQQVAAE